jgi:hypothetical protein
MPTLLKAKNGLENHQKLAVRSTRSPVITDSGYVCSRTGEASAKITTPEQRGLLLTDHLNSVTVPQGASLTDHIEAALARKLHLPA